MNDKPKTSRNLIIAVAVLVILAVAAYFYSSRERGTDELLSGTAVSDQVAAVDGDLLKTLGQLRKLKLDDSIFSNPVWESLRDFGQTLAPASSGRANPFAPF